MKLLSGFTQLLSKEGAVNPFLLALISQLSTIGSYALAQQGPKAEHYSKIVAKMLLEFEVPLRESVLKSPSPFDDAILDEVVEMAHGLVPGYEAEVWPQE